MTNVYNESAPVYAGDLAKSTLTAFFDSRSNAETAIEKLRSAGVADVRLMPGYEADGENAASEREGSGFWGGLADWFFPTMTATSMPRAFVAAASWSPRRSTTATTTRRTTYLTMRDRSTWTSGPTCGAPRAGRPAGITSRL